MATKTSKKEIIDKLNYYAAFVDKDNRVKHLIKKSCIDKCCFSVGFDKRKLKRMTKTELEMLLDYCEKRYKQSIICGGRCKLNNEIHIGDED